MQRSVGNIYCVGRNHIGLLQKSSGGSERTDSKVTEQTTDLGSESDWPLLASKATGSLNRPDGVIRLNSHNRQVDWEAELVIRIDTSCFALSDPQSACDVIGAWGVGNDVTDRWWQSAGGGQWIRGKSFPGFAIHNIDANSPKPDFDLNRRIQCWLNDELMQDANLSEYRYPPQCLVFQISQTIPLDAGDLIFCGTFPGCGFHQKPPRFLQAGDRLRTRIEGLGELNNLVVNATDYPVTVA